MKLIVYFCGNTDSYVNISADRIVREEEFVLAYNGDKLVGIFEIGVIAAIYLSERTIENGYKTFDRCQN